MTRRTALVSTAGAVLQTRLSPQSPKAPVVNAAEHAWVIHDPRFRMDAEVATCPTNLPDHEYPAEYLIAEMKTYKVDAVVISHVCYYGRNNSYTSYCIKKYPGRFAGIGLLVGHRLHAPADPENAS